MPKEHNETPVYQREMGFDMLISVDASNRSEYVGIAYPGGSKAASSSAVWCIYKLTYNVSGAVTERRYANADDKFNKTWDDRATYSY